MTYTRITGINRDYPQQNGLYGHLGHGADLSRYWVTHLSPSLDLNSITRASYAFLLVLVPFRCSVKLFLESTCVRTLEPATSMWYFLKCEPQRNQNSNIMIPAFWLAS